MKDGKLRWGICSAGKICNDFVLALKVLPSAEHEVTAVAARDIDRAKEFGSNHGIPKAYGEYEQLANDPDVDIAYVGVVHTYHYKVAKMMLESGKHVLCEKPMCVTVAETKRLIECAKSKNLFLMEAVWSRTFPVYQKLRELIDSDAIGEVRHVWSTLSRCFPTLVPRFVEKQLGGGAILDLGIYPVQFVQMVYGEKPLKQITTGFLQESGCDAEANILLQYSNNRTAMVHTSLRVTVPDEALVCGTKGYIKVCSPMHCPRKMELHVQGAEPKIFDFQFPEKPAKGSFNFRNSIGLSYEAAEVRRCLLNGWIECPLITGAMSIGIAEILQAAREEIGYKLPQDDE